jgi:hypothetical protein
VWQVADMCRPHLVLALTSRGVDDDRRTRRTRFSHSVTEREHHPPRPRCHLDLLDFPTMRFALVFLRCSPLTGSNAVSDEPSSDQGCAPIGSLKTYTRHMSEMCIELQR